MRIALLAAALAATALGGCARDAGPPVERAYQVGGFNSISLAGSQQVIVTVGGAPSVRAEGPERRVERLEIAVENGTLRIGERDGNWSFGFRRGEPVTVHVTVPSLGGAEVGGSGNIRIDRISGERFVAVLGGSGNLEIGQLRVREASFAVGGSGAIRAEGAAERSHVELAGSGTIDLGALEAAAADIDLAGSGNVMARATRTARVSLAGSGDVTVTGPARCSVEKHGSGEVRCGG